MKKLLIFFITLLLILSAQGNESLGTDEIPPATMEKLPLSSVITGLPGTTEESFAMAFSKKSLPYWGLILGSTALLYEYDEDILAKEQRRGRRWGIGNDDHTEAAFQVGPWDVRFPTDTGSSLYFFGDGIVHLSVAGSLFGYGYFTDEVRPYNTGLQLVHGIVISTFFSQVLKRSFGRESPVRKSESRGAWDFFPSFQKYNEKTAKYDAMPSGHVMTATLTFTVLIENYPEYKYWLRPLEITYITLLGWQMVNNGVHWVSDYPLGIAMGYVFGKAAARLGKSPDKKHEDSKKISSYVVPGFHHGTLTTELIILF